MAGVVADLDAGLQAMLTLKAPGVSGTKIQSLTNLCVSNVQSESVIVQKIYTHFKKTPGTHKLGVLYVVDSVTRQWVDHAKKAGQVVGTAAGDGTYAAGVNRVTELLPVLMNDILQKAPADQKGKINKLVEIWERGSTFPASMLTTFKDKLSAPQCKKGTPPFSILKEDPNGDWFVTPHLTRLLLPVAAISTTPPGTPPVISAGMGQPPAAPAAAPNTSAILETLKNMAKQNNSQSTQSAPSSDALSNGQSYGQNPVPQLGASNVNQAPAFPSAALPQMGGMPGGANLAGLMSNNAAPNMSNATSNPLAALAAAMPPQANAGAAMGGAASGADGNSLQNQLMLIQFLMQQGVPQQQWGPVIAALTQAGAAPGAAGAGRGAGDGQPWSQAGAPSAWNDDRSSRDQDRSDPRRQSPPSRYPRDRSRSPPPAWRRDVASPPRAARRPSPVYGEYGGDSNDRSGGHGDSYDRRGRERGGRGYGNDYRQRSPRRRSPSPRRPPAPPEGAKWMDHDPTVPKDSIKVLSRTLFVGGVTSSEEELRTVFGRFGTVQTCIVNHEKRHAFIKMVCRHDAVAAKEGMELHKPPDLQLRTRWGVGFGPRDCSDYATGISIIPISKLTDADRKWMLSADFGGSGGKPIEGQMVVEEPDIEIGAGVSSKAISRRMATDQGGKSGPRSSRTGPDHTGGGGGGRGGRRGDRQDGSDRESVNAIGVPPAVPTFGFQFPNMPNGMPMLPPNFSFPGASGAPGNAPQ
ncbi:MAG: hypothetical protein M4579_005483 [Chaenotheca gracillima]|nr:MAG: hypothetical protein M4579_005483 [Chaenotheca gracillima]